MPTRPPRLCARHRQSFAGDRCPLCAKVKEQQQADRRGAPSERLYDWRWRKAALAFLALNPLCYYCQKRGRTRAAKHVDHATPHKGDPDLFWNRSNWRSACAHCNSAKGGRTEAEYLASIGVDP